MIARGAALLSLMALTAAGAGEGGARPGPASPLAADTVHALTLLHDREGLVPLPGGLELLSVTLAPAGDAAAGQAFDAELRALGFSVESVRVAPDAPYADSLAGAVARAELVVVGAYADTLPPAALDALSRMELGRPVVVAVFGRPGLVAFLGRTGTYLVAPGRGDAEQRGAARGLAGTEPIRGVLAADLPPHRAGEGLRREGLPGRVGIPRTASTLSMAVNFAELDPADAGMDAAALDRLDGLIRAALADSAAPGAALAIGRKGRLVRLRGYGTIDWEDPRPVSPATIFDLASLTKVVATTPAAMLLEAEGKLELDAPVVRYLPWLAEGDDDDRKERITVRQLLAHRSGFAAFRPWYREHEGPEGYREAISEESLESDPGTRTVYSDTNFMLLGFVVEAVTGAGLDRFVADRLLVPLGMEDTGFRPDPRLLPRIAPTELDTVFRHTHVRGVVHDENAYAMGGVAGHAGLFSTAWDLAIYADLLLGDGLLPPCAPAVGSGVPCTRPRADSLRVLPAGAVARWTRPARPGSSYALGWDTPEGPASSAGVFMSDRAFGHTGFTGTSIWIDPELDLYVVLLTNRVDPSRANSRHVALRRAVADAAASAIRDRDVLRRR